MSPWSPCKRRDFIKKLYKLGFDGPYSGAKHHFMVYRQHRLTIPSNNEFSTAQLRMMIREAEEIIGHEISSDEWNTL